MRLLILSQYYPPEIGAAPTRLSAMARALMQRGHEVEVVTGMPNYLTGRTHDGYRGRLYMRDQLDGAIVHRTWVYAATGTGLRRLVNYLSFACTSSIGLLRARRPDAIFVESPPLFLSLPGWIAAQLWRCALIFNVADLWPDSVRELGVMREGPLLRAAEGLEAWTYKRATLVNAVTHGIERDLRVKKCVPTAKLRFLPNGIDVEKFTPRTPNRFLAHRLQIGERPLFLYAGTHGIAQGLHNLIEAALLAPEMTILFVGAGSTKAELVALARRRHADNVHFLDPVPLDEMPEYFSLASASIVPLVRTDLNRDARPSKLFPSLACGVPVIFSGEGEAAEIIRGADAGIVVPPEDPAAIADAMRSIVNDTAASERRSRNARALAVERFAWQDIVDRWLASL